MHSVNFENVINYLFTWNTEIILPLHPNLEIRRRFLLRIQIPNTKSELSLNFNEFLYYKKPLITLPYED